MQGLARTLAKHTTQELAASQARAHDQGQGHHTTFSTPAQAALQASMDAQDDGQHRAKSPRHENQATRGGSAASGETTERNHTRHSEAPFPSKPPTPPPDFDTHETQLEGDKEGHEAQG